MHFIPLCVFLFSITESKDYIRGSIGVETKSNMAYEQFITTPSAGRVQMESNEAYVKATPIAMTNSDYVYETLPLN